MSNYRVVVTIMVRAATHQDASETVDEILKRASMHAQLLEYVVDEESLVEVYR